MEPKKLGIAGQLLCAAGLGIASFLTEFFLIPKRGVPDWVWMGLMLLVPAVLVWLLEKKVKLKLPCLLAAMAAQYALLILLAEPLSVMHGIRLDQGFGWFGYIGAAFLWPAAVTAVQMGILFLLRKIRK